ncbi:MAG: hypothetical protein IJY39_09525 [Clostridia bacterium]|nr:hypothetical protein [Clostridia bacterium]
MSTLTLPKGYYAVQSDWENASKDSFTYKGISYAVTEGVNLFPSLAEANKMAVDTPDEVISGLEELKIEAPVILFSDGRHTIDKFAFNRSVMLLGQHAGVMPELPALRGDTPDINPIREENESVLYGSYWFGVYQVGDPTVEKIIVDGFSVKGARFNDLRRSGGKYEISFRNMIHQSHDGHTLYTFAPTKAEQTVEREVLFENIRVVDFDDCDYGAYFINICATRAVFDHLTHACTNQTFGLTNSSRTWSNTCGNTSQYVIKNSLFKENSGFGGFMTASDADGNDKLELIFENTCFVNASQAGCAPLTPKTSENVSLTLKDCYFLDTRKNEGPAVQTLGNSECVALQDSVFEGFAVAVAEKVIPVDAPDHIGNRDLAWESDTEDPHVVIGNSGRDMTALDALYEGRSIYRGDLHVHTKCGGTSDGNQPMNEWPAKMDALGVDFAAVVDHRQMRGFFLPEWDEERFIIGTEPGAHLKELNACRHGMAEIHYNMLFPHKYGLAMVLANFPEFQFHGDELTGSFRYFTAPKSRYIELFDYVKSIGGIVVHAHPKTMLVSSDPLDYYYGEHTYIETIYDTVYSAATRNNYKLWCDLIAMGKRVYASGGSDSHTDTKNSALSSFYTSEKSGLAFFNKMHEGDFNVGAIGIKMAIDSHPMGSEIDYKDGMKLSLRVADFFAPEWRENTVYALRIFTDKGLVYSSEFNGKEPQELQLEVQKRAFYRADIYDMTHECVVAVGNPIWINE